MTDSVRSKTVKVDGELLRDIANRAAERVATLYPTVRVAVLVLHEDEVGLATNGWDEPPAEQLVDINEALANIAKTVLD